MRTDSISKPLKKDDSSGFKLVKEVLDGQDNFGINIDRLMYDKVAGRFVAMEFQLCKEEQGERGVTPHTSHPNRYWERCKRKYFAIWRAVRKLEAKFWVVNYAEAGTTYANEVRLMEVIEVSGSGIQTNDWCVDRRTFQHWLQQYNRRCG